MIIGEYLFSRRINESPECSTCNLGLNYSRRNLFAPFRKRDLAIATLLKDTSNAEGFRRVTGAEKAPTLASASTATGTRHVIISAGI